MDERSTPRWLATIGSGPVAPQVTCPDDFGVQVAFMGHRAVVAVRGELDIATAPTLRTMLDGPVDGSHQRIVLDLEDVTFMGAAGLGTIIATLEASSSGAPRSRGRQAEGQEHAQRHQRVQPLSVVVVEGKYRQHQRPAARFGGRSGTSPVETGGETMTSVMAIGTG